MSTKVSALSHLEFRVWVDAELVADDFGVLPDSPAIVRAGNDALSSCPDDVIRVALDALVKVGLMLAFRHQSQAYLCDPRWQDFQKIVYPRRTYYPAPGPEVFRKLSVETQKLFRNLHPSLQKVSASRARYANANAERSTQTLPSSNGEEPEKGAVGPVEFAAFWSAYPRKTGKGAALRIWVKMRPPLDAVITALDWQRQSADWTKDGGQFIPHPSTYLNERRWEDEPRQAVPLIAKTNMSGIQAWLDHAERPNAPNR